MSENLGSRLVAFFDILGFSNILCSQDVSRTTSELSGLIEQIKDTNYNSLELTDKARPNFDKCTIAFDSMLFVSHPVEDYENISRFILACASLVQTAAMHGFMLRGAIDLGEVFYSHKTEVILSKIQPRLAKLEKEQEWVGCSITNEAMQVVVNVLPENFEHIATSAVVRATVPLKNAGKLEFALNWPIIFNANLVEKSFESLIDPKKQNTIDFFNERCKKPGFAIVQEYKGIKFLVSMMRTKFHHSYLLIDVHEYKPLPKHLVDEGLAELLKGLKFS